MGAKVLQVAAIPRNFASADNLLDQLSGAGRLIFIPSTATEPAWEIPRFDRAARSQQAARTIRKSR